MKPFPKPFKPVKAWAVVESDGLYPYHADTLDVFATRAAYSKFVRFRGTTYITGRLVPVLITPIPRKTSRSSKKPKAKK